ncbi:MAG: helix-turn-helix domain-containing protein [Mobilitalea sp.]
MSVQGSIAKNRASGFRHHSYELEQQIINSIIKGDIDAAMKHAQKVENISYKDILAPQPLRAQKNLAISLVAVVSRATIEHGAEAEAIFFLSDYFLNEIEQASNNKDLERIIYQMITEYCTASKEAHTEIHSAFIQRCLHIIHSRTYERCTVEEIACSLNLSPDYISVLFKKEMGCGMYSYIQKIKMEEAKNQLENSDYSICEIGEMLGFCNGAYFSNVFKKLTGFCPKTYRMEKQVRK